MEKVFAMDAGEKFDVARLGSPSESVGSDRDRDRGPNFARYGDRGLDRKYYSIIFSMDLKFASLECNEIIFQYWLKSVNNGNFI